MNICFYYIVVLYNLCIVIVYCISQGQHIEINWKKNCEPDWFGKLSVAVIMEPWQIIKLKAIKCSNNNPIYCLY